MKPPIPTEEQEHRVLAQWLDLRRPRILWCHVPNGGSRNKAEAAKLKAMGVKAGVPDFLIFSMPSRAYDSYGTRLGSNGVAIELKRQNATDSAATPEQRAWAQALKAAGWTYCLAKGAGEAIQFLSVLGF